LQCIAKQAFYTNFPIADPNVSKDHNLLRLNTMVPHSMKDVDGIVIKDLRPSTNDYLTFDGT
jgi:hypothetical protein